MNLVVDTNIVFSALLNPYSIAGEILMNIQDYFAFFAPELLKEELKRHHHKIIAYSKLDQDKIAEIKTLLFSNITFVSEELISQPAWTKAYELTEGIDEDDTPFIALAIELNVWTGDGVLTKGLLKKGSDLIITTAELKKQLK